MKKESTQLKVEQMDEKEWALECAVRILKRKHEAGTRHMQRLMNMEAMVNDLKMKMTQKDALLKKLTDASWEVIPISTSQGPETIPAKVSIIIPVKNAGEQLGGLLAKIRSQRKIPDIEIIVLDSGSSDDSISIATQFGATVLQVPPEEFNHGATRNLGAAAAQGDYIVFTVQDAVPTSDYWLYRMVCSFIQYPELAALSVRQVVKPEADLFSLWSSEGLSKLLNYGGDVIYRHAPGFKNIELSHLDNTTKRRLTFFDNVSSCVRGSVFREMNFSPLMNAEDIDFGVRLFAEHKDIGYLTSAGVYHWHERGAEHVFKRHYIGVKSSIYTMKNELEYFFKQNAIDRDKLVCCIAGAYELIHAAVIESRKKSLDRPVAQIEQLLKTIQELIDKPDRINGILENVPETSGGLAALITLVVGNDILDTERKHDFKKNFLISDFMRRFKDFVNFLCTSSVTLEGREQEFNDTIMKIFAQSAGDSLGYFYIEEETLERLTPDLVTLNHALGKGICY